MKSAMRVAMLAVASVFAAAAAHAETIEVKPALVFVPDETGMRLTQVWGASPLGHELPSRHGGPQMAARNAVSLEPAF